MVAGARYGKDQKDLFFKLVDRGGTVRAAAKAAGVNQSVAYRWLREAGLSMQRATPRTYTQAEKDGSLTR